MPGLKCLLAVSQNELKEHLQFLCLFSLHDFESHFSFKVHKMLSFQGVLQSTENSLNLLSDFFLSFFWLKKPPLD